MATESQDSTRNKIQEEMNDAQAEMTKERSCLSKLFQYIFYTQFLLISVLVIFLTLRGVLSAETFHFHLKKWYLPAFSSTASAGIIGFLWQAFTRLDPSRTIKVAFWLSPLLTCGFGILLVCIGTPGGLAASVIALASSVLQSLYACWVSPRFKHTNKIIKASIAYHPAKVKITIIISIVMCTLYVSFCMCGIGGATAIRSEYDLLFILLILGSLAWTMQIVKNMMQVTVSHISYMQCSCGMEVDFKTAVKNAGKYSFGSIVIASIIVPVLALTRGLARAVSLGSGDVDEFMFSCANCCSGLASRIVAYGSRWGFLHMGVYNKGIVQASTDTWDLFRQAGMENLISSDLTSSFCLLCGITAGSMCALVGGTWALAIHDTYATELSIYTFIIGYLMTRVAMGSVQASVTAYYVAYAENPQIQQFENTILPYIRDLERSHV